MKNINEFKGLYPVSKTLRFELIPQGKTLEHIQKDGLLEQDEHRAQSYILVKKIIDEYHKGFIVKALTDFQLLGLEDYFLFYSLPKRTEEQNKKFVELQSKLRKQIADRFTRTEGFKNLFAKELIKDDLKRFIKSEEEQKLISEFENFTTYFTGFHENRKNMYSSEEKATAIAFRLIHENLPKFIDNMRAFDKVKISPVKDNFRDILSDSGLGPVIQVNSVEDMFSLEFFNETLSQLGIDRYNHLIGGFTPEDDKEKIKGLNEYINLYNQTAIKENRLPKLKPLYKQILSDRSSASFIPEEFTSDHEVLESIETFYQEIIVNVLNKKDPGEISLKSLLENIAEYDLNRIYLRNDLSLTEISQKTFGDWNYLQRVMAAWYDLNYTGRLIKGTENYEELQKKYFKNQDSFSIGFLDDCVQVAGAPVQAKIENYFKSIGAVPNESENLLVQLCNNYEAIKDLLNNPYPAENDLARDQKNVSNIKIFLESIKAIQWFIKPLLGKGTEADKDERFYGEFSALWTTIDQITPLYNKVRNYMTRKPYSTEKIKLNFENPVLLDGWPVDRETATSGVIFSKNGLYYLGILDKKEKRFFKNLPKPRNDRDALLKMNYLQAANPSKDVQNLMVIGGKTVKKNGRKEKTGEFAGENLRLEKFKNEHLPEEINTIRKGRSYLKHSSTFNKADLTKFIDFYKQRTIEYFKAFNFTFKDSKDYTDFDDFTKHINQQAYQISLAEISESFINQMVEDGKLYLFKIYNKDFSEFSKGTPNLHTLYWKMLFDPENLKDVVFKLNGQAEVFYRKSSIKPENQTIHKAHHPIDNKNLLNDKKQSKFDYDIVKDRRYTLDKFQFHVPVTMNFKAKGLNDINADVNLFLKNADEYHVIGIDRGERHLLYLTLIDQKGNIKQQFSLNEIINECRGKQYATDYHALLDKKEGGRDEARRSWQTIETIKELKEGYLSQVIHKIAEMMIEYKAIVVLEDLNIGFMRGRQKVEKQVYQKFEKMLIDKLNFLVDKTKIPTEDGGTLNAYQLTNKFKSFRSMGKQNGFLFYVPAWNTSKMDPVTGFVNLFDTRYESVDKAKSFFSKFNSIHYNPGKGYFEFDFDYGNFNNKAEGTRTRWTLCTYNNRIETFRNPAKNSQWDNREVNLTLEFRSLFDQYGIDFSNGQELRPSIEIQTEKSFFETLLHLLKLTLQMRNSITGTETDYLVSPVSNDKGEFYDSRTAADNLPQNADANGAYNIARKGLWAIEQIKQASDLKKIKLAISNKEWLSFVQNIG